ncbi:ABC transporter ATP-binding protein [Saccharothrix obliqua]|uniref:ABC transporter ATP-binding protein n=1 Tax=Saccharothrix obliqua TaxID=2861747 RepID=UPI001C5E3E79|nr:ABC transporter ATP-binding protein [Saccharothrix obliqua]MBW4718130.1 ABC transporter ATP-binding protein [Saccharothrix obliqua]
MKVEARGLSWGVPGRTILRDVDLTIADGEKVGLIGPNGSGKSSLLRCVAGLRAPTSGEVRYDGVDISRCSARTRARHLAFVEQTFETECELTVAEVVSLGRTAHRMRWSQGDAADEAVVRVAIDHLGLTGMADKRWKSLSGGERQRTQLARALAQRTPCLLLDEPTNHLDIRHCLDLLDHLAATSQTVVVSMHDLALAGTYCDRLVLVHNGRVVVDGAAEHVLSDDRLREVFGVEVELDRDSAGRVAAHYRKVRS